MSEPARANCIYTGRSILTPDSVSVLRARMLDYLEKSLLPEYRAATQTLGSFADQQEAIIAWYKDVNHPERRDSFTDQVIDYFTEVLTEDFHAQAQALSGFNDALLGQKQMTQFPVMDPLGLDPYQVFAEQVRSAVGKANRLSPQPQNDFLPLRTGKLCIRRLRLVDSFGLIRDVLVSGPALATNDLSLPSENDSVKLPSENDSVKLPPRFVQPLRLDWRWFSASGDQPELNDHPATTPICGWLLTNNLDNSLMVYDENGRALGTLTLKDDWWPAPGNTVPVAQPQDIPNRHLRRVVEWLVEHREECLQHFISTLDSSLENIDPDSAAHHENLALLMGRPVAVVRASIALELRGLPATNQDWNKFYESLQTDKRATDGIEALTVPLRLGEHNLLNDGLVGYWTESEDGTLSDAFHAPQASAGEASQSILTYSNDETGDDPRLPHLPLSLGGKPHRLTLLVDPRGSIHATCGVLPVMEVRLPQDQVKAGLSGIAPLFFTAPILTGEQNIEISLPKEPGYVWNWIERVSESDTSETTKIVAMRRHAHFDDGQTIAREGWLHLRPRGGKTEDAT